MVAVAAQILDRDDRIGKRFLDQALELGCIHRHEISVLLPLAGFQLAAPI
jgi:hypothetical protein